MSTTFEDRLQLALRDLADDIGTGPALSWSPPLRTRSSWVRPVTVAALVIALVASALLVLGVHRASVVEPVQQPPRVLRLATTTSAQPGPAVLAFALSGGPSGGEDLSHHDAQSVYLLAAGTDHAVRLTERSGDRYFRAQLTGDGRHLLLQIDPYTAAFDPAYDGRFEVVDLRTGQPVPSTGTPGLCPELSGDGTEVAFHQGSRIVLLNVRTGSTRTLVSDGASATTQTGCAGGMGWAPDGSLLAVGRPGHRQRGTTPSTRLFSRSGRLTTELPGHLANSSMSWSPDGRSLLLYDNEQGRYYVGHPDGTVEQLGQPHDAYAALGWAGSRIVWIAGSAGDQRLVTTDQTGGDVREWLRFEVGDDLVTSVQWSTALAGTARR